MQPIIPHDMTWFDDPFSKFIAPPANFETFVWRSLPRKQFYVYQEYVSHQRYKDQLTSVKKEALPGPLKSLRVQLWPYDDPMADANKFSIARRELYLTTFSLVTFLTDLFLFHRSSTFLVEDVLSVGKYYFITQSLVRHRLEIPHAHWQRLFDAEQMIRLEDLEEEETTTAQED
jgi:hypothetical protein